MQGLESAKDRRSALLLIDLANLKNLLQHHKIEVKFLQSVRHDGQSLCQQRLDWYRVAPRTLECAVQSRSI